MSASLNVPTFVADVQEASATLYAELRALVALIEPGSPAHELAKHACTVANALSMEAIDATDRV